MAFGVFYGEVAASVEGVVERGGDIGSGGYGAGMGRVGVRDGDVETAGLDAAQLIGGLEVAVSIVVLA
jgi:hypothetical protein